MNVIPIAPPLNALPAYCLIDERFLFWIKCCYLLFDIGRLNTCLFYFLYMKTKKLITNNPSLRAAMVEIMQHYSITQYKIRHRTATDVGAIVDFPICLPLLTAILRKKNWQLSKLSTKKIVEYIKKYGNIETLGNQ